MSRYIRPKTWTPEQTEFVRANNGKMTAPELAKALGLPRWKIDHIRRREGISAAWYEPWTEANKTKAHDLYIVRGLSALEAGKAIGVSDKAVRFLCARQGWKRDNAAIRKERAIAGTKARAERLKAERAARLAAVPAPAPRPVKPPPPPKPISASDAELIAEFLAKKSATVLPTMYARGVTEIERRLGTVPGDNPNWWRRSA